MAPRQRKGKDSGKDSKPPATAQVTSVDGDEPTNPVLALIRRHPEKTKLGTVFACFAITMVNIYVNPPDRYKFADSYKAPALWYGQLSQEYVNLTRQWNYSLPEAAASRLHALHGDAGVDVAGLRVLEVGAGGGLVGSELRRLGYGKVVGLDISPEMANLTRFGPVEGTYADFIVADAEALPMALDAGSVGAVLCVGTSGYLARGARGGERDDARSAPFLAKSFEMADEGRVAQLLDDWLRVLQPGGLVGLSVESSLAAAWERVMGRLAEGEGDAVKPRWVRLEVGDVSPFPAHNDHRFRAETARLYFYRKLA